MQCPFCESEQLKVLESRSADDGGSMRRRRECLECEQRFTTYERVEFSPMIVTKRSNSKEVYSRDKLISSIVRSCSKSEISALTIDHIVDIVETQMYKEYGREIPSTALGAMVMAQLKIREPMAYIRYASIFKNFNSVSEFLDEIQNLDDKRVNQEILV
ncbi:MAG: transcriptional regulator NrdR [Cyanobacteria bacterium]|nr:transcriptional regulator NrdR [Cyanobacteriota bacterium]MDA1020676.1 transcriptional regulator NrdR [Cyanobacteriota bacterium]